MKTNGVPMSDLLCFLVDNYWYMDALPDTLRPFTERQLRSAWGRTRRSTPISATTVDHIRIAILIARNM